MNPAVNEFTHFQWGDPMLAQMAGSDAQAYGTDPHASVYGNMTSSFEQAPTELVNAISPNYSAAGSSDSLTNAAQDPTAGNPQNCPSWDFLCKATNGNIGIGPGTGLQLPSLGIPGVGNPNVDPVTGAVNGKSQFGGSNAWMVTILVGLLAIGIIFIGIKALVEA